MKVFKKLLCKIGIHNYSIRNQELFTTSGDKNEVVIAWKNCERCYNTKLIHVLK